MKQSEKDQLISKLGKMISTNWFTTYNDGRTRGLKEAIEVVEAMPSDEGHIITYNEALSSMAPIMELVDDEYWIEFSSQKEIDKISKIISLDTEQPGNYDGIKSNYPNENTFMMCCDPGSFRFNAVNDRFKKLTFEEFINKLKR